MELDRPSLEARISVRDETEGPRPGLHHRPNPPLASVLDEPIAPSFAAVMLADIDQRFSVVAVIPAFNEDRFIASVVLKARQYVDAVIVVDDGSTDMTAELAEAAGAIVVKHERNLGKSAAINTGLCLVQEMAVEAAVFLDGDGQHHPEDIPHLVEMVRTSHADIVVGSRFLQRGNHIPRWRLFGQHTLTAVTNILSGVSVTDSQSGFRALSSRAIEAMRFGQNGFTVESEMQFQARECDLKMIEAPISVTYAEGPKRNPVSQAVQVINGVLRLAGQHRPLLFFSVPGVALLVTGASAGLRVVLIYQATMELAIGHALLAVLAVILGTLSLSLGVMLHSIRGLLIQFAERQKIK